MECKRYAVYMYNFVNTGRNEHKNIFKDIADIKFKYLKDLYLGHNFI